MVVCPSVSVRNVGVFTIGAHHLQVVHTYHRRELPVMSSRIGKFLSRIVYPVLPVNGSDREKQG